MRAAMTAFFLGIFLAGATGAVLGAEPPATVGPPPLRVEGNRLKTPQGAVARLEGVNIASLEWASNGENVLKSLSVAIEEWGSNAIRLPLSQDGWFGRVKEQADGGAAYRELIRKVVRMASAKQCYVVLDLHWSNGGVWGHYIGQHCMPDDNSAAFWKAAADAYANHPAVLFGLYNEPHDVSREVWRNGGTVRENSDKAPGGKLQYHTPGMQKLVDVCRDQGAKNVIVAGGLDWAYELSAIAQGYALADDRGHGVVYDTHIYPWKKDWDRHVTVVLDKYPVLVGEVGCQPGGQEEDPKTWAPKVLDYIDKHQLHWTAWDLHPAAGSVLARSEKRREKFRYSRVQPKTR